MIIDIMMGLPGSGKTTFSKKLRRDINRGDFDFCSKIVSLDGQDLEKGFRNSVRLPMDLDSKVELIVDGLILTNEDIRRVLQFILENSEFHELKYLVNIYHWNKDRKTCLYNDKTRGRETSAKITIKSAAYEDVDIEFLSKTFPKFQFNVIERPVLKADSWHKYFEKYLDYEEDEYEMTPPGDYCYSEEWGNGGTWCNCWGDEEVAIKEDPIKFTVFDEIIDAICPNISHKLYEDIKSQVLSIESRMDHDYYGGVEERQRWQLDLRLMQELLIDNDLLSEE
jgi:hypothetical protein